MLPHKAQVLQRNPACSILLRRYYAQMTAQFSLYNRSHHHKTLTIKTFSFCYFDRLRFGRSLADIVHSINVLTYLLNSNDLEQTYNIFYK